MFRSLHMKLMLIMTLLIISIMTVVGAFLVNSVSGFYLEQFYSQMQGVFQDDPEFFHDLENAAPGEESGAEQLGQMMEAYTGNLGVDGQSRNYYVLDGAAAAYMDVAIPVSRGGREYVIYIKDNKQAVQNLTSQLVTLILEALIFGIVISVLLSFLLSKTLITPIERLTEGAEEVAAGDFGHKIEVENERNKLGTLFLHMTDGVVAFGREGDIIQSNPAAEEMLGRSLPIGGEVGYEALFGDIAPLAQALEPGSPGYLAASRESRGRSFELLLAPFDRDHQAGVLVVIHDVTERNKAEEQRKEFVANVSHELRTPLTNIHSYAETLVDSGGELPAETEEGFLKVILSESERMAHIVQDLLTLSRFDSGRSELNLATFSFAEAIESMVKANLLEARRHGHTLTAALEPELPQITADRERITQVMMNVVSNAIKYTPEGGTIAVTAGKAGDRVWLEVADNGIGVPEGDRDRIFERFYRVDKARSRESGGTGLGLSIAKEIVDQHGGEIKAVDKPGPGLTIRVELPVEGPRHGA